MTTETAVAIHEPAAVPAHPMTPTLGMQLRTLAEYMEFADIAIKSGLALGHKNAASVVIALQMGAELGLSPMQALRNVHIIQGRPLPSADCLVAVARSHPACMYLVPKEQTAERATWETHRRGDPAPTSYTFTMADAKAAKLTGKDNWTTYPARMLSARAKAFLVRDVYPDRLAGVLTVEEAQDMDVPEGPRGTADVIALDPSAIRRASEVEPAKAEETISGPEVKRLMSRAWNAKHDPAAVAAWLERFFGINGPDLILRKDYDAILARMDNVTPLAEDADPEPAA